MLLFSMAALTLWVKAMRSLNLQVMHQSAVMFTNTGLLLCRACSRTAGVKEVYSASTACVSVPVLGINTGAVNGILKEKIIRTVANIFVIIFLKFVNTQIAKLIEIAPVKRAIRPLVALCWAKTHASHKAETNIGKARNCLNFSIHAPGLGSIFCKPGRIVKATYGKARPSPKNVKINIEMMAGCVNA